MKSINLKIGGVIILLLSVVAFNLATAETAADVFKRAKAKQDELLSSVKDLTIEQDMIMFQGKDQSTTSMKMMYKGKKFRFETSTKTPPEAGGGQLPEVKTAILYDGKEMWMVAPFAGKTRMDDAEAKKRMHWTDNIPPNAKLVGKEKVSGRSAYKIEIPNPSEEFPYSIVWIDEKSLTMIRATSKSAQDAIDMKYSDFRKIYKDFEMPYLSEFLRNGELTSKTVTKSVKVNSGLSDDLFDPSKLQAQGPSLQDLFKGMQGD